MPATIAAIHAGHETEPTTVPLAVAIYRLGTSLFESGAQAAARFNLERQRHRCSRSNDRTKANLERHGRRVETCHSCSATSNDEAGNWIGSTACERRR